MQFSNSSSDEATLAELGRRLARYRLNRNLTQEALASEAGISLRTLHRVEHGQSTQATNLIRVLRALGLLDNLEALAPEPPASPLQELQLRGRQRRRASGGTTDDDEATWSWGDEE